ncbi:hypothetical protein [uncultured Massilia sp.]|uniref:hypothetical protein n=1 Tax=uncultured Massilia sp. TaxID=169973 RepID=UPI0025D34C9D|nr:hypothetical protein [uncultured Massilia sp.]
MRDKKDNATIDLPGFESGPDTDASVVVPEPKRSGPRPRRMALRQEQLALLEDTDATGLPVWKRDPDLDLTGLPVWKPD